MLHSHPDICCHGEILGADERRALQIAGMKTEHKSNLRDLIIAIRKTNPALFLRDFALYPGDFLAVGLKIKYSEFLPEVLGNAYAWVLENNDVKIIHLRRRNLLRRFVSHQLALQTGVNMVLKGGEVPAHKSLHLDFDACVDDFATVRANEERFSSLFSEHSVLDVAYEAVIDPQSGERARILDFLSVHYAQLATPMIKLGRDDLAESVENYEDLRRQSKGTCYAHFFD